MAGRGPGGVVRLEPGPPPRPEAGRVGAARDGGPAPAAPVRSDAPRPAAAGAEPPPCSAGPPCCLSAALAPPPTPLRPGPAAGCVTRRGAPSPAQWRRAGAGGRPPGPPRPLPSAARRCPGEGPAFGTRGRPALFTAPRPKAHPPTRCAAPAGTLASGLVGRQGEKMAPPTHCWALKKIRKTLCGFPGWQEEAPAWSDF